MSGGRRWLQGGLWVRHCQWTLLSPLSSLLSPLSSLLSTLRQKPNTNNGYFSIFTAGSKKTFQKDESSWVRRGEFSIARTLTSLLLF